VAGRAISHSSGLLERAWPRVGTHLLRRGLPLWVDEGLSDFMTGYWNPFDLMSVRDAAIAGAGQLLPAWLFGGLAAVLVVALPRLTAPVAWALIAASAAIALFGPLVGLDAAIADLSPFAAAPIPSSDAVDLRGIVPLALVTAIAIAGALTGMRRRELAA